MDIGIANNKEKYFWNMLGSICNAVLSIVLLLIINRVAGSESGGIFSLAYSNAQLMMVIGGFEIRTLQATDIKNEFKFETYFTLRLLTIGVMVIICAIYASTFGFNSYKSKAIITFGIYKAIETMADVFAGVYQQQDRIDLCGKLLALRVVVSGCIFFIFIYVFKDINIAGIFMSLASLLLLFIYDIPVLHCFDKANVGISFEKIGILFFTALPLFISAFIMMYINNAPKYSIARYCTDIEQNLYGILFMPAFAVNLFSLFIFRPMLVDMKVKWDNYNITLVKKYIQRTMLFILAATLFCVCLGIWIGVPVLSMLYGVDLRNNKAVFMIIMIYGGFNAYGNYFYYVLTVMREQKKIMIAYIIAFIAIFFLAPFLVRNYNLVGAAFSALLTVVILDTFLLGTIMYAVFRHNKDKNYMERKEI